MRLLAIGALAVLMAAAAVGIALGGGNGGPQVLRLAVDGKPLRVVVPDGDGEGRPLLLFLHGRGQTPDGLLTDEFFAALDELGDRAPVVALPYGGEASYWHDRRDGRWGRHVMRAVLPRALKASGADGVRVAIGGISMGGFGAYDIARLHPRRFCAVGGHSPALWRSVAETAPGAFDDAADFARHDVVGGARALRGVRTWLDAGRRDPFLAGARAFIARHGDVRAHFWAGGHDSRYWGRHWDEYLGFYARALRRCG